MPISLTSFFLFAGAVLFGCTILKGASHRIGIPALLTFILLGMLCGSDGLVKIPFNDYAFAEQMSTVALVFIVFYGGFGTNWKVARPVAGASIVLSSLGTMMTAGLVGGFCTLVLDMPLLEGLLCGALLSSTDAASVFSILRSRNLALKENTDSLLEVESGSNDPFAYMLTMVLLAAMQGGFSTVAAGMLLVQQLALGALCGFAVGLGARYLIEHYETDSMETSAIFMVAMVLFSYGVPLFVGGNGFLSVYIVGILLGNSRSHIHGRLVPFFDGITGIMQAGLFFLLGLLAFPSRMLAVWWPALAIALFLTLVARPVAVHLLMLLFGGSRARRHLVSFAGLRGAASIVFAIIAVTQSIAMENDLFHIVFLVVLFSIAVQGSLLPLVAKRLDMIDEGGNVLKTFSDYVEESPVNFIQFRIKEGHPWCNQKVKEIILPPGTILAHLCHDGRELVPKGDSVLHAGDLLVLCATTKGATPSFALTERVIEPEDLEEFTVLADFPHEENALVMFIERNESYIIPNGSTVLEVGDHLLIHHTHKGPKRTEATG